MVQDCLKQFARLAGRADDKSLAPLQQLGLRHDGHALEILEIAVGDQPVEIAQADGVFRKDDDMPRTAVKDLAAGAQLLHARVDLCSESNPCSCIILKKRMSRYPQVIASSEAR